jgi:hypothetical protein
MDKWMDNLCDGILGRDFLQRKEAQLCHRTRTLVFREKGRRTENKFLSEPPPPLPENYKEIAEFNKTVKVKRPVTAGSNHSEGVINIKETKEGVSLASSLTKVEEGQVKILNTTGNNTRTGDLRRGDRAGRQRFFIAKYCCNKSGQRQENFEKIEI